LGWKIAEVYLHGAGGIGGAEFPFDSRKSAEHQVADVCEDSGALSGDAVCGEQLVQFGERTMDADGGLKSLGLSCEERCSARGAISLRSGHPRRNRRR